MRFLSVLELLLGIVVVGVTLFDLFQSVVLPRPAVGRIRLSPWLIRLSWAIWRRFGRLQWENGRREAILGSYGPLALLTLLGAWVLSLVLGYGLVLHSLGSQLSPAPDFGTALYFSGAALHAATLVMTTVEGAPHGHAKLMYGVGTHLVEDLSQVIGPEHDHSVGIERFEFDDARERLSAAGYELRDADLSWERFSKMRSLYAVDLNALARHWEIPPSLWIGDRTLLAAHVAAHARPAH